VLPGVYTQDLRSIDRSALATEGGEQCYPQRQQCRDDGGRALRAIFSSHDNWLHLSQAERDEWRGYFDRMLGWLHHLGYTAEHNPCSMLLQGSRTGTESSKEEAPSRARQPRKYAGRMPGD
jgi:hypothetical protein